MTDKLELIYPKAAINATLKIDGVFAFPQQWKTTDESNPGMFTYVVKFCNMEISGGKIYPKQLTQKQLRQQEQAKKKGGKKQAKKEQSPAQIQRMKQMMQKQEAEERKKQQAWAKMSQQQRFYSASEDKYKSGSLKFENGSIQKQLTDNAFVAFEEHVEKDGGQWVYLFKIPTANEQQLEKIKKSKPKTLNLADLNPICMRAWVDLSSLWSSQVREASLRCKVTQVDQTAQTPKPNLEKTYIKLSITLNQALVDKKDAFNIDKIIKNPPEPTPTPADVKCIEQMKDQLRLAIESLAMEYSNMFWRDLNANEDQKSTQIFVGNKKNEHTRRKQQFLYDFNVSGKYKVLKQRLKKVIVHLCENKFADKMQGAKSFTGITSSVRDQFYSQIYNFLVASYSNMMQQMVQQKKQKLKQVLVLNQQNQNIITEEHLQAYKKQTQSERFSRIVRQYSLVGNYAYGQQMYKNALVKQPRNIELKYQYSMFCLKNGINSVSQVLSWGYIEEYLEHNKGNKNAKIQYVLLMIGSEQTKSLRKAWIILRELVDAEPHNVKYLLCASLLLQILNKTQSANKLKLKAYRNELRTGGQLKQSGKHRAQPAPIEIPSLSSIATYSTALKPEQADKLWSDTIQDFSALGLFNIVEKIKSKLQAANNPILRKQNVKILYFQQQYKESKDLAVQIYNESKDFELLEIIVNCCHKLRDPEQKVKYLKIALKDGSQQKKPYAFLNLAFFYLQTKKYGNCKACITKYLAGNKQTGGLSWQLLGTSEMMCGNYSIAVDCFRQSNLCDPLNKGLWIDLALAYCKMNNFVMVTQCLNCYFDSQSENKINKTKISEVKSAIDQAEPQNFYQTSIKQKLLQRLQAY